MMNHSITNNSTSTNVSPSGRGGHQMIWDSIGQRIYLLGGWDGKRDLADFWSFDPVSRAWTLISSDVEREGGPSGRSCHKAALHTSARHIYILGRYIEPDRRDPLNLPCDFYRYDLETGRWTRLSSDVRAEGGPGCIYDHQMIVDEEEECLWVFGGRLLSGTNEHSVYSGMYRYDLRSSKWTLIHSDSPTSSSNDSDSSSNTLPPIRVPSRIGHSMLFDPQTRTLLILSGQRYKDQLTDFYRYSIDRNAITHLCKNLQMAGGPDPGYTQRAVIDSDSREMFVFSSMVRNSSAVEATGEMNPIDSSSSPQESNSVWSFDLRTDRWNRINTCPSSPTPSSRFAHQLTFDPSSKTLYLFGGNPGNPADPTARLDDFWSAQLLKMESARDIIRRCQFLIRKAMFESMLGNIPSALQFLQTQLAAVVNHSDPIESVQFRSLSTKLFISPAQNSASHSSEMELFDEIVKFLPKSLQPPINNL